MDIYVSEKYPLGVVYRPLSYGNSSLAPCHFLTGRPFPLDPDEKVKLIDLGSFNSAKRIGILKYFDEAQASHAFQRALNSYQTSSICPLYLMGVDKVLYVSPTGFVSSIDEFLAVGQHSYLLPASFVPVNLFRLGSLNEGYCDVDYILQQTQTNFEISPWLRNFDEHLETFKYESGFCG